MAAETVQVNVQKIIKRNDRYSFVEDGEWYGLGWDAPTFGEGDTIQFDYERNGKYKNVVKGTVQVISQGEAPKQTSKPKSSGTMTRDEYWAEKAEGDKLTQREIRMQASRNAAIEFMKLALEQGALPLGNKKAADKEEVLLEYLKLYTRQFFVETVAAREEGYVESNLAENNYNTDEDENDLAKLA